MSLDDVDHGMWSRLLHRYVNAVGHVDYHRWKASDRDVQSLDDYLKALSSADPNRFERREAQLAFWINAYNALTVKGILARYSMSKVGPRQPAVSANDVASELRLLVGDQSFSLDDIENRVLRQLKEPRVHAAIVCGAKGCPRLMNEAYTPADLERQLSDNSRAFFADPTKCLWLSDKKELSLSPILKWCADDFGSNQGESLRTIAPYLPESVAKQIQGDKNVRIRWLEYDWSLNEPPSSIDAPLPPPDENKQGRSSR